MPAPVRKRFGQHFLQDSSVLARIVDAIDPHAGQALVEIGPGRGALTAALLQRVPHLRAIELDRDLVSHLRERYPAQRLEVIEADVLDVDFAALRGQGAPLRLAGNLPYNISTPLLFHVLGQRAAIEDMHFMLQKEVVDRMSASPGSKAYGRLTVMLAPWMDVHPLFDVPPGAFRPAPRVQSTVVRLRPLASARFDLGSPELFARVVREAFSQRRKTLRNALQGLATPDVLRRAGIDPGLRAERLRPEQFADIARALATPTREL